MKFYNISSMDWMHPDVYPEYHVESDFSGMLLVAPDYDSAVKWGIMTEAAGERNHFCIAEMELPSPGVQDLTTSVHEKLDESWLRDMEITDDGQQVNDIIISPLTGPETRLAVREYLLRRRLSPDEEEREELRKGILDYLCNARNAGMRMVSLSRRVYERIGEPVVSRYDFDPNLKEGIEPLVLDNTYRWHRKAVNVIALQAASVSLCLHKYNKMHAFYAFHWMYNSDFYEELEDLSSDLWASPLRYNYRNACFPSMYGEHAEVYEGFLNPVCEMTSFVSFATKVFELVRVRIGCKGHAVEFHFIDRQIWPELLSQYMSNPDIDARRCSDEIADMLMVEDVDPDYWGYAFKGHPMRRLSRRWHSGSKTDS